MLVVDCGGLHVHGIGYDLSYGPDALSFWRVLLFLFFSIVLDSTTHSILTS